MPTSPLEFEKNGKISSFRVKSEMNQYRHTPKYNQSVYIKMRRLYDNSGEIVDGPLHIQRVQFIPSAHTYYRRTKRREWVRGHYRTRNGRREYVRAHWRYR